mmetsp:Transcript_10988/g.25086  ORF Transcript_10988/g.25086 Transcript_10988/m.25086 type:complete len:154 (-) Transcript_10988:1456-1917(-)
MSVYRPIHEICFGQHPVPVMLQLRTTVLKQLPRVLRGVARNLVKYGLPSSTTDAQARATRFLLSSFTWAALEAVLASIGAGGFCGNGMLTCKATVRVWTVFFFVGFLARGTLPPDEAPLAPLPGRDQLLKDNVPAPVGEDRLEVTIDILLLLY